LKGVFKLIELPAPSMLCAEMEELAAHLLGTQPADGEHKLAALSGVIMVLTHYLEYVHVKQKDLPSLLIPAVNEIRETLRKTKLPDSHFFNCDVNAARPNPPVSGVNLDELGAQARRLRHMYEVGLIGALRDINLPTSFKLMDRALERIDNLGGDVKYGKLWWMARGALAGLYAGDVELTNSRKSILGQVDRQIKLLVFQGTAALNKEPPTQLLKELLYINALAQPGGDLVTQISTHFGVNGQMTDADIRAERELMNGPGGSVMKTVASAVKEELAHIKDTLDLASRGAADGGEGFSSAAESMDRIANTLVMLGLVEASNVLKEQVSHVRGWSSHPVDPASDEFQSVADALLYVENRVVALTTHSGSAAEADQPRKDFVSRSQLDEARQVVVGESRAGLSLAKRAIVSFIESKWDSMHLSNVPTTLTSVWGGLMFLQLERAARVLRSCNEFIEKQLIRDDNAAPSQHMLDTLADAITSIDYYLESMEANKPIGEGVLDVAEESVNELGFPVAV
ncbi:MAG TPA: ferrous iron transporter B, partial [Pseudomonadales bacterium]|nr:ferrous iron transporter B [Pseudomonadales bacterium]